MENTSTTNVDSKETNSNTNNYDDEIICCATTNLSIELNKDGPKLIIPPENGEYVMSEVLTSELEYIYKVSEIPLKTGDTKEIKEKKDKEFDKYLQEILDNNGEVPDNITYNIIYNSSFNLEEIKKSNNNRQIRK